MSAEEYCLAVSRKVAAMTFLNFGFNGNVTEPVLDIMGEVIGRYLHKLGTCANQFKEHADRTEVNLGDVQMAFDQFKISTSDLEEYFRQMEPTPYPDPVAFPVAKKNSLSFMDPSCPESLERPEYIFNFLPSMVSRQDSPEKASPLASQNSQNGLLSSTNENTSAMVSKSSEYLTPVAAKRARSEAQDQGVVMVVVAGHSAALVSNVYAKDTRISELPEEAGHSHYEMKYLALTSTGVLNLKQGIKPASGMPPPPLRYTQPAFADSLSNMIHDQHPSPGGNKENTDEVAADKPPPPVRISVTSRDGATIISGASGISLKADGKKPLKKKRDKKLLHLKNKKPKRLAEGEKAGHEIKMVVDGSQNSTEPTDLTVTSILPKSKLKKKNKIKEKKQGKIKEKHLYGDYKVYKSLKLKEKKEKNKKVKVSLSGPTTSLSTQQSSSCSTAGPQETPSKPSAPATPVRQKLSQAPETGLRRAFCSTDIFDTPVQQTSAQQLLDIDDSINAVVRDSAAIFDHHDAQQMTTPALSSSTAPATPLTPSPSKKRGRPKKPKQTKSSEFVAEDVLLREAQDDLSPRITTQQPPLSLAAAVACQPSASELLQAPPAPLIETKDSGSAPPKKKIKKNREDKKKKQSDKDGLVKVKKPKKKRLLPSAPSIPETKPEPDRFTQQQPEMKVFDFGQAESPPSSLGRRPSQAEAESSAMPSVPSVPPTPVRHISTPTPSHVSSTPTPSRGSLSPLDSRNLVIMSPTPEAVISASSASASSATSLEQPPLLPLKIGLASSEVRDKEREREKQRERSKDREHRKEKKEKKKKREKDHSRDRHKDRHEKHKHKKARRERKEKGKEMTTAEGGGFKLRIKIGSNPQDTAVMANPDSRPALEIKPAPEPEVVPVVRPSAEPTQVIKESEETLSPCQGALRLVIRKPEISSKPKKKVKSGATEKKRSESGLPRKKRSEDSHKKRLDKNEKKRREGGSSHKKRKISKSSCKDPRNTPPTLHRASPLPGTPPPPVLSRNNSPVRERSPSPRPPPAEMDTSTGRSPVKKVSPKPDKFIFTSPSSSPPRGSRLPTTPPPHTPSPSRTKSPSPMPKTPSPHRQRRPSSPLNLPMYTPPRHRSPLLAGRKSPTPTPKTPSLSPAYQPPSPLPIDDAGEGGNAMEMVGSPPPSPCLPCATGETEKPAATAADFSPLLETPTKPKGKVGRPRSKSPRSGSPKGRPPKAGKSPKVPKEPKPVVPGKAGRGRPPKAKTLAIRAAQAEAAAALAKTSEEESAAVKPPPLSPVHADDEDNRMPPPLPLASVEVGRGADSSASSSPDHSAEEPTLAYSGDSQVEVETVGSFIDSVTGETIWICPGCKLQDDGTPMIGCDKCDDWYHWACVNLTKEPPKEQSWFCPRCTAKAQKNKTPLERKPLKVAAKGKRGRKKKLQST